MKIHHIKTIQPYFDEVKSGRKKFEYRLNDRDYNVGDTVFLKEYIPEYESFSGREIHVLITYVLKDYGNIPNGYCIFSFKGLQHIDK